MEFYKIKELVNKGVRLDSIDLNVAYYARVSSLKDEQLNSLDNQINYFESLINNNPKWNFVKGYVDEGISGSTVKSRKNFLQMIEDSKYGIFDLIITKEVSRFSRNLYDSIKYTQELTNNNVGVYFETNNLNTFDNNSEFILNLMSSLAQEEVKRLSSRIKWGAHNAQKRGRVLGSHTFGYKKKNGVLMIDEYESKIVKKIFDYYVNNNIGIDKISYLLGEENILNKNGNLIDASTIKRIIRNPKYKGVYQGHTTEVIDYKTKKRIQIDDEEKVIFKSNEIPAIVTEEIWNKANEILNSRKTSANSNIKKYPFSGILICSEHNKKFIRSTGSKRSKNIIWACSDYMKYRLKACRSPLLKEEDLIHVFKTIFSDLFFDNDLISDLYKVYNIEESEITKLDNALKRIKDLYIENLLTKEEFETKKKEYEDKIIIINNYKNIEEKINKIFFKKERIELYINNFIEKIYVEKIDYSRNNILLKVEYKNMDIKPKIYDFIFDKMQYKVI